VGIWSETLMSPASTLSPSRVRGSGQLPMYLREGQTGAGESFSFY
jgi:hypothetical protein